MIVIVTLLTALVAWAETPSSPPVSPANSPAAKKDKPIKVFLLVGDENILEQGVIFGAKPGTLETVVAQNPKFALLKSKDDKWVTRNDVVVYDLNPLLNNTVAKGLQERNVERCIVSPLNHKGSRPQIRPRISDS